MKKLCIFVLAVFCLASCQWFGHDGKDRQAVLVYFAGNNNLSAEGESDLSDITSSWLPSAQDKEQILMVYYHFQDKAPVLSRFYRNRQGVAVEDVIKTYPTSTNSASASTMETIIADAEKAYPAERHGMVLWSHGTGFLPRGYFSNPKELVPGKPATLGSEPDPFAGMVKADESKSFGLDGSSELDITDLRNALSPYHYDFLIFDCCLMAHIELAFELRNTCDYLLFSPTEILSDGFPYGQMMQPLFSMKPEAALKDIAGNYMAHYRSQSGMYCSATITLVSTAGLEHLAASCRPIFQNHQSQILSLDRSRIQPYFRFDKHWFYDLDDFIRNVADDSEYADFAGALDDSVIFKDTTESFLTIDIRHYSGLSIYIPRAEYTVLNNFYKTLEWNKATGLVQ